MYWTIASATRRRALQKLRKGRKLQFSYKQLQIIVRRSYDLHVLKISILLLNTPTSSKILIFL